MKIYIDENGTQHTLATDLKERNEKLIAAIKPKYEEIYEDYKYNQCRIKPLNVKFGGRITQVILTELSKEIPMSRADYVALDYDDLSCWFTAFMEFMCEYAVFEPPITKQLITAYIGISVSQFNDLLTEDKYDDNNNNRKDRAIIMNDYITGMIFSQAESSNNNASPALFRSQVKNDGQGVVKQAQQINFNVAQATDPTMLLQKAREIASNMQKQIGSKKNSK